MKDIVRIKEESTKEIYSFLWRNARQNQLYKRTHFDAMQEVISDTIVRGARGIDVGCGKGCDTYRMASLNPRVKVVGMDISDGVYSAAAFTHPFPNVSILKASLLNIPVKNDTFDFAYSFGVLHHITVPDKGLQEITRVIKRGSPVYVYLYEDHCDNTIKYHAIRITSLLRGTTTHLPPRILYWMASLFSPIVFILFSFPAIVLRKLNIMQPLRDKMPFNFAKGPFSLKSDLYDRFGAPVELRFNKEQIYEMFDRCGLCDIHLTRLQATSGWVAWGYKR